MGFAAMGLLTGCNKHHRDCRCDKCYDLSYRNRDSRHHLYDDQFRPPPPRPVRWRGEDRDDFEDRLEDWEDDCEDWEDDYEDWLKDRRKARRKAYNDRYDR
jgi:hypothetical protein